MGDDTGAEVHIFEIDVLEFFCRKLVIFGRF